MQEEKKGHASSADCVESTIQSPRNLHFYFLVSEAPPIGGIPTGPKVLLDFAGRVWAAALCPDPL